MKTKSPPHRLIQLRRKTQKIILPKASWDLSNKQNQNGNQHIRSNKNSSKKSSIDRKHHMKKSNSLTSNLLKQFAKQTNKTRNTISNKKKTKQSSYASVKKLDSRQESRIDKNDKMKLSKKYMTKSPSDILDEINHKININNFSKQQIREDYSKVFNKIRTNQKVSINILQQHLNLWIDKYQQMKNLVQMLTRDTSKFNGTQQFSEITAEINQMDKFNSSELLSSDPSYCQYIVDPKQQICYRSLKAQQIKDQLHLNLSKVEQIRRRQFR